MATSPLASTPVSAGAAVRVLPVDGMHCAACASKVERAAGDVRGVREASVSFATKRARIAFDPTATDLAAIARAVRRAGFVLDIERDPAVRAAFYDRPDRERVLTGANPGEGASIAANSGALK